MTTLAPHQNRKRSNNLLTDLFVFSDARNDSMEDVGRVPRYSLLTSFQWHWARKVTT